MEDYQKALEFISRACILDYGKDRCVDIPVGTTVYFETLDVTDKNDVVFILKEVYVTFMVSRLFTTDKAFGMDFYIYSTYVTEWELVNRCFHPQQRKVGHAGVNICIMPGLICLGTGYLNDTLNDLIYLEDSEGALGDVLFYIRNVDTFIRLQGTAPWTSLNDIRHISTTSISRNEEIRLCKSLVDFNIVNFCINVNTGTIGLLYDIEEVKEHIDKVSPVDEIICKTVTMNLFCCNLYKPQEHIGEVNVKIKHSTKYDLFKVLGTLEHITLDIQHESDRKMYHKR